MTISRREMLEIALSGLAVGVTATVSGKAIAATQPVRIPLSEFVKNDQWVRSLRRGVREMKKRKPSDPLSWFFQAAIHGVTPQMMIEAAKTDPDVAGVNFVRCWNQCPHNQQNSANFLPWHRAYTHHFEKILRMHVEDENFALPYWDYSHWSAEDWDPNKPDRVKFPKVFGVKKADGDDNPLFHAQRNYFLCGYDHPLTDQLPLSELTASAVDIKRAMTSPVFFGDTEAEGLGGAVGDTDSSTRGLLEQCPHDQIHRVVGGMVEGTDGSGNASLGIGGMAIPMTAGFDPIFPVHHSNIDRLWAKWSCMPSKSWGKLPSAAWFNETPWVFFGLDGKEIVRPRKDYFDYRGLGVRFADEDLACTPLALPGEVTTSVVVAGGGTPQSYSVATIELDKPISATASKSTAVSVLPDSFVLPAAVSTGLTLGRTVPGTAAIALRGVHIHGGSTTGFDVHLVRKGTSPQLLTRAAGTFLGSISLFNHGGEHGHDHSIDQTFFVTKAMQALDTNSLAGLEFVFVPYELATAPKVAHPTVAVSPAMLMGRGLSVVTRAPINQ